MNTSQAPGENLKENSPVLCFTFLYRVLAESAHTWLSLFCYVSPVNKLIYTRWGFHQEVPVPFADHKSVIEQVLNWWAVRTQLWRRTLMWLSDLHGAQEHPQTHWSYWSYWLSGMYFVFLFLFLSQVASLAGFVVVPPASEALVLTGSSCHTSYHFFINHSIQGLVWAAMFCICWFHFLILCSGLPLVKRFM